MNEHTIVREGTNTVMTEKHSFFLEIITSDRTYYMAVVSAAERGIWIEQINKVLQYIFNPQLKVQSRPVSVIKQDSPLIIRRDSPSNSIRGSLDPAPKMIISEYGTELIEDTPAPVQGFRTAEEYRSIPDI